MTREEIAEIIRRQTLSMTYWTENCLIRYVEDQDKSNCGIKKHESPWYGGDLVRYITEVLDTLSMTYQALIDENYEFSWDDVLGFKYPNEVPEIKDEEILGVLESDIRFGEYEVEGYQFFGKDYKEREARRKEINAFRARLREALGHDEEDE